MPVQETGGFSRKQLIYLELMRDILPWIRNVQTNGFISKGLDKSCYYEAELVHNLPVSLLEFDFVDHDIGFLNAQAKWYITNCNSEISPLYGRNCQLIHELISIIPNERKKELTFSPTNI